jgi:hypothetical protein
VVPLVNNGQIEFAHVVPLHLRFVDIPKVLTASQFNAHYQPAHQISTRFPCGL